MSKYWSYVDALGLALALQEPDKHNTFTADPAKWHEAIYQLRKQYLADLPLAFRRISFDTREGQPPYSPQVEHFLHVMAQGGLMSEPNPAYTVLDTTPEQKKALLKRERGPFADDEPLLTEIGRQLSELLRD